MLLGEWLNGRVAVSKTVGCVFESRLPCHSEPRLNTEQVRYVFVDGVAGAVFSKQG